MSVDLDEAEAFLAGLDRRHRRAAFVATRPKPAPRPRREPRPTPPPRPKRIGPAQRTRAESPGFKDPGTQAKAQESRRAAEQRRGDEVCDAILAILQRIDAQHNGGI